MVRGRPARRWRCRLLAAATLAVLGALRAVPVSAHTELVDSSPADGSAVASSPGRIELHFTRDVSPPLALLTLKDAEDRRIEGVDKSVDPARPTVLIVTIPHLPNDAYRLSYNILDQVDFHRTQGSIVFGIGGSSTLAPEQATAQSASAVESGLRFADRGGLSVLLGVLALCLLVLPRMRRPALEAVALKPPLVRLGLVALVVMAVAEVGLLLMTAAKLPDGSGLGGLLASTDFGHLWIVSAVLVLGLGASLAMLLRQGLAGDPGPRPPLLWVGAVLGVADALVAAAEGHNGAAEAITAGGVLLRGAHLVTVGAWAGGLVAGCLLLLRLRAAERRPARAALLRALSPVAALSFLAAIATGLLLAGDQVETVTALLSTSYGTLLIIKVVAVILVGAFGLYHAVAIGGGVALGRRLAWHPRSPRARTLAIEAAGGLAVIGVAIVLGGTQPARGATFEPLPAASAFALTTTPADLQIRVALRPNLPGANIIDVTAVSRRRPAPGPITNVQVSLSGPAVIARVLDLGPAGSGPISQPVTLTSPGSMTVAVSVLRDGQPTVNATVPWQVDAPAVPRHPTVVSSASLAPFTIAGALAVLGGVGAVLLLRLTRQRRQPPGNDPKPSPAQRSAPPEGSGALPERDEAETAPPVATPIPVAGSGRPQG